MKKELLVFLVISILITGCASEITGAKILNYGILTATNVETVKAKDTASGTRAIQKDLEFEEHTTLIPATIGKSFGIKYVIDGKPDGMQINIKVKGIHPPIRNPERDKALTSSEYTLKRTIGNILWLTYTFKKEWELVPGKYTFQIHYKEQKLLEKTFTVYLP
jgi:hypothetical protein